MRGGFFTKFATLAHGAPPLLYITILIWEIGMTFLKSSLDENLIKDQNISKDIFCYVTSPNNFSEPKNCPQLYSGRKVRVYFADNLGLGMFFLKYSDL